MTEKGINAALVELQGKLPRITKDLTARVKSETKNIEYRYSYADLALISREVLPLLATVGLAFVARPTMQDGKFVLAYELLHTSGDAIGGVYPLPERGSPQEIGSAITYARRYCLCAVTGVAPDDDDNDAIVAEKAARRQRREAKPSTEPASRPAVPPMDSGQQKQMQKLFEQLGMGGPDGREARLSFAMTAIGRNLRTATDMTYEEAARVILHAQDKAAAKSTQGGAS